MDFERRKIEDCRCGRGVVYAGVQLTILLRKELAARGVLWRAIPVFFTRDYIATFDRNDLRWHLRYGVFSLSVRIRYRHEPAPTVEVKGMEARVRFKEPQFAAAPGQIAAFYEHDRIVGSGQISRFLENKSRFSHLESNGPRIRHTNQNYSVKATLSCKE